MNIRQLLSFLFVVCLSISYAFGQSDSVKANPKKPTGTISRSEIQRVIRYITRANIEEKTLIKVGILPNTASFTQESLSNGGSIDMELSVERKLSPSFSVLFGFDNKFEISQFRSGLFNQSGSLSGQTPQWYPDRSVTINSSVKLGVRYYYSMARRIREGKSANNFSGTYITFQARRPVLDFSQVRNREYISGDYQVETRVPPLGTLNTPSFGLLWGIQQRLGRRGYIDLSAGPEVRVLDSFRAYNTNNNSRTQLSFRINAIIGLGW
ncbi:hypothetical protein [Spirosoma aerophilum]